MFPSLSLFDSVSLQITALSGKVVLNVPDLLRHARKEGLQNFWGLIHHHKVAFEPAPWPRIELILLDVDPNVADAATAASDGGKHWRRRDEEEANPELVRCEDGIEEEILRCARIAAADSVSVSGFVGCLPVGVRLELRMTAVVRDDWWSYVAPYRVGLERTAFGAPDRARENLVLHRTKGPYDPTMLPLAVGDGRDFENRYVFDRPTACSVAKSTTNINFLRKQQLLLHF